MDLKTYLNQFNEPSLELIGPFYEGGDLHSEPVVFVDGGVKFKNNSRGFSVGDGDSAPLELDQKLNTEKDFSDLAFVLAHIPDPYSLIRAQGFLGHRKDHEIMNLAEVHRFMSTRKTSTRLFFENKIHAYSKGSWAIELHACFSLFAFAPLELKLSGDCDYKIDNAYQTLRELSSHGLSNRAFGKIEIQCSAPVFLFIN